jgi:hypothetical protein
MSMPRPRWYLVIPCLLIVLYAAPLVFYRVPSNLDTLDESFEPLKTLKFIQSKGKAFHKWGPMPVFVYAPVYAPSMAYWYLTGDLARPSGDYPYGFARPHEQQGFLIVLARLAGLAIGLVTTAYLGWALARLTGAPAAAGLALVFCMATSPEVVFKFVSSKPDGLMLAFLAGAMAVYARIVSDGLTRGRGVALSLLAVFSISCKELTAPAFVLPYLGIAVSGWLRARTQPEPEARRRFLANFMLMIVAGLAAYFAINVVYAPSTWQARMREWLQGPGKDPAVWARPGYTTLEYLLDVPRGLLYNFDAGGVAVLALATLVTLIAPVRHRLSLWLPSVSFLVFVVLTAGYMPQYFLGPLNVTATLPVAAGLAYLGARLSGPARGVLGVALALALAFNLWGGNAAWARAYTTFPWTSERYCLGSVDKNDLVFLGNLWVRQNGFDRLSYLGFNVDDRPLGALMARPDRMPDVVLATREELIWLDDFKKSSARNAMMTLAGYSYDQFPGYEGLGYRLIETVRPRLPWPLDPRWAPWYDVPETADLLIYRRGSEAPR